MAVWVVGGSKVPGTSTKLRVSRLTHVFCSDCARCGLTIILSMLCLQVPLMQIWFRYMKALKPKNRARKTNMVPSHLCAPVFSNRFVGEILSWNFGI